MTVQIDLDRSGTSEERQGGYLVLINPERGEDYASWPFHVTPDDHYLADETTVWKWENPDDPLSDITLSPSLLLEWDDPNTFHIFVRDGEVDHCADCGCGCP